MDTDVLERYDSKKGADSYAGKFDRKLSERINNWHEQRLVERLLDKIPAGELTRPALDMPCGCGRLYPLVRERVDRVVEGDWGFEMIRNARSTQPDDPAFGYVRGTALQMPFADRAFDLVFSVRLCHHIREHNERLRYVREILRISNRYVLFTYFDTRSIKNRWREFRRRFNKKRSKWTLSTDEVRAAARELGFDLVEAVWLSRFFSGHRYALLKRRV